MCNLQVAGYARHSSTCNHLIADGNKGSQLAAPQVG
jgi:hypothetical protein